MAARKGEDGSDFVALLAMRLAYEVVLGKHTDFSVRWDSVADAALRFDLHSDSEDEGLIRLALLRATEMTYRKQLLGSLAKGGSASCAAPVPADEDAKACEEKLAQMVFCIDVRSERMRRNLESVASQVETLGFAGFFGLPVEYVPIGESDGSGQVPVLLQPQFQLREGVCAVAARKRFPRPSIATH